MSSRPFPYVSMHVKHMYTFLILGRVLQSYIFGFVCINYNAYCHTGLDLDWSDVWKWAEVDLDGHPEASNPMWYFALTCTCPTSCILRPVGLCQIDRPYGARAMAAGYGSGSGQSWSPVLLTALPSAISRYCGREDRASSRAKADCSR